MKLLRSLRALVWAIGVTSVAWWGTLFAFRAFPTSVDRIVALALALAVIHASLAWLLLGAPGWSAMRAGLACRAPHAAEVAAVALLVPSFAVGAAIQAAVRASLGATPAETAFEWSDLVSRDSTLLTLVLALAMFVVVIPVVEEAVYRGILQPGLGKPFGAIGALAVSTVASAIAFTGARSSPAEGLAVLAAALVWSFILGAVRLATGSLVPSILLRAGLGAVWIFTSLLMPLPESGVPRSPGLLVVALSLASVACGLVLLWRVRSRVTDEVAPLDTRLWPAERPLLAPSEAPSRLSRLRFPWLGIAMGAGLLVAECVIVVAGFLESFGGAGIAGELALSLVIYVVVGAAIDLAVQALLPRAWSRSLVARGLPLAAIALAVQHELGLFAIAAFATVPLAATWAWAAGVSWARPLAAAMAIYAACLGLPPADVTRSSALTPSQPASADAPSFLVVVLDTVRRDHVSAHGYARKTTPHLDALAERGTRFDGAYSSSCWSVPSHASLFTGLLAHSHGATFEHLRLEEGPATLAEVLAGRGYDTAGFSPNPYITGQTGMARGFATFVDLWRPFVTRRALVSMQAISRLVRTGRHKGGPAVVRELERWLAARDQSRPYFAFVNLMEAHAPYQDAPLALAFVDPALRARRVEGVGRTVHDAQWLGSAVPEADSQIAIDLLDGATLSADHYLGEILALVGDSVHVIVLSDHGDLAGEHGLHGHMTSLYEPLIRIPLIMAGPSIPRALVVDGPVSIADVMPTVLSLAGVPSPPTEGIDLVPALQGETLSPRRTLRAEHDRNPALLLWAPHRSAEEIAHLRARKVAVVMGPHKRVVAEDGSDLGYDLAADGEELHPIAGALTGLPVPPAANRAPTGPVKLDPATLEALRSLGYVQ